MASGAAAGSLRYLAAVLTPMRALSRRSGNRATLARPLDFPPLRGGAARPDWPVGPWRALTPRGLAQGGWTRHARPPRIRRSTPSTSRSRGPQPACSRRVAPGLVRPAHARTPGPPTPGERVFSCPKTDNAAARVCRLLTPSSRTRRWARSSAPGWSAPWHWCSSSACFSERCVHTWSLSPLLPWGTSCPPAQPIPLSLCLPHSVPAADTRASPRRCPPASRSGRCCLQPARTSGARTQGLGVLEPKSCQAAHSPLAPPLLPHRVAHSVWQRQAQTCCVCHEVLVGTEVPVQVCCCCACWACTSGPRADGTAITPRRARCAAWRPTRSACTS